MGGKEDQNAASEAIPRIHPALIEPAQIVPVLSSFILLPSLPVPALSPPLAN